MRDNQPAANGSRRTSERSEAVCMTAEAIGAPTQFARLHELPADRQLVVLRVRREIAEGTYDTDEKLEIALDRLMDRWDNID